MMTMKQFRKRALLISFFFRLKPVGVRLVVIAVFAMNLFAANAQGYLRAEGKRIVNERGENVLLRGIGLGGWMLQEGYMLRVNRDGQQHKIRERIEALIGAAKTQEFYDAWLSNHTRKIDIDSLKAWGFNSVRLPMHYNLFTLPVEREPVKDGNTWLAKGFALTDSLLAWCKAAKMYLILDLHAAPGGQGKDLNIADADTSRPSLWESEANRKKMIALWRKLAERYAAEPWIGGYDIINEPNWGFADLANDKNGTKEKGNEPLRKLMQDITGAIREVDPKHIIIIEGNGWGNNYSGILPPWDKNTVLSFHKYWNKNDLASIQHILKARDDYNVPVWLGETGENSNVWFTQAVALLESNNIGWAWWPLKKVGFNNPLQIGSNKDYEFLLRYWNGGEAPSADAAYKGLMQLAADAKLENATYHKDVIDALFRQPFSGEAKPFKRHVLPTTVMAVDYDLGRNGVAYYDQDTADYRVAGQRGAGNKGRVYRNDGVDIRSDSSEGYYVSDMEKGEWLQYTISVPKKGKYALRLQVASLKPGGKFSLRVNGKIVGQAMDVPQTGSYESWAQQGVPDVLLESGNPVIRVYAEEGTFSLKSLQFAVQK